jgi:hypothetical protein
VIVNLFIRDNIVTAGLLAIATIDFIVVFVYYNVFIAHIVFVRLLV